jgi:glycosyltransferase involved in cell wall biosynthesis
LLTLFSTPKPFSGHADVIQRNAIKSWTRLHPEVEVILFGDDDGTAEICREYGIRHEPKVERHEKGPKYLNYFFDRAQEIAKHDVLCYVNCDIILMSDFRRAVERVILNWREFLMVGRRWNAEITTHLNFDTSSWEEHLQTHVTRQGACLPSGWIDYFVFSRGLYHQKVPPFVIGRNGWDPWLIWKAIESGATVVDASPSVVAIHQNHDYAYLPKDSKRSNSDDLTRRNMELFGGWSHWQTTDSAKYVLTSQGVRRRYLREWIVPVRQNLHWLATMFWFRVLDFTRPMRRRLGIRQSSRPMLQYVEPDVDRRF